MFVSDSRVNAYTSQNLHDLRQILDIKLKQWPDEVLHRHTNVLAIVVGMSVKMERDLPPARRIADIDREFRLPAQKLLRSIRNRDRAKEFYQPWGAFREYNIAALDKALASFVARTNRHVKLLKTRSEKGKLPHSELKDHFIYHLACLSEYLKHDFEPSRNDSEHKGFGELARILGAPLFGRGSTFNYAVRKHVDNWNWAKRNWKEIFPARRIQSKATG